MEERTREWLDRAKETAGPMVAAAGITMRYAGKRAAQVLDIAKLNLQLLDQKAESSAQLQQIGQLVYQAHLGHENRQAEIDMALRACDKNQKAVDELNHRIALLRSLRTCPHCGANCGRGDKFCRECGTSSDS